ncbi:MAG TPA: cytochrome c oxidase subunit 3 [Pyrinomonadaceae bacterium]|jgi:heme/copper-type cytochrome/quinol oxidase subunit 3|nr:cytochrome c oxidase subunit 3 [Pyrinomonadaceae bacterium]
MSTQAVIDISKLPRHQFDTYDPVWWGNNLLLAIETSMFGILIATYFYLRQNFPLWPPPLAQLTATLKPLPQLGYGTATTIVLLAGCIPMVLTDISARRGTRSVSQIGLVIAVLCGVGAAVLRGFEFSAMYFRWDSNAYGSVVWFMLGMHMMHLCILTVEAVLLAVWIFTREYDMKHRVDIVTVAIYWYWVTGIWVVLYAIIYFTPRLG